MCISSGDLLAPHREGPGGQRPVKASSGHGRGNLPKPWGKKKTARLDINRTGLSFYPSKIEWDNTISGSYWRFLGFHLIFHNQLIAKSSLQLKRKVDRENYFVGYLLGISIFPKVLFSQSSNRQRLFWRGLFSEHSDDWRLVPGPWEILSVLHLQKLGSWIWRTFFQCPFITVYDLYIRHIPFATSCKFGITCWNWKWTIWQNSRRMVTWIMFQTIWAVLLSHIVMSIALARDLICWRQTWGTNVLAGI